MKPSDPARRFFEEHFSAPEMGLLLACCRRFIGAMDDAEWLKRIAVPCDEAAFSGLCRQHRLSALVHKTLIRPHPARFSQATIAAFESEVKSLVMSQLHLANSALEIHRALEREKIRHLFLKGPVLSGVLFGTELLRFSLDLDILIEPGNVPRAHACLGGLGFQAKEPVSAGRLRSVFFRMWRKDIVYRRKGTRHAVELHWKTDKVETVLNRGIFSWDRDLAHHGMHNESFPMMEDYHNCLYLCLHAAKHHWTRLQWLLDIALLVRNREIDSGRLMALAGRYGLRNVVHEAGFLSQSLLGADIGLEGGEASGKAAAQAMRRIHLTQRPGKPVKDRVITYHRSLLYPRFRQRLKFWLLWISDALIFRLRSFQPG